MPAQRASKGFKDISLSFQFNPLTNDLIAITDKKKIKLSVLCHENDDITVLNEAGLRNSYEYLDQCVVNIDCPLQIKAAIAQSKLVIGSRYHALVSALSSDVPVLCLGWSHKYAELMNSFGQEKYMFEAPIETDKLIKELNELLYNDLKYQEVKKEIRKHKIKLRAEVQEFFDKLKIIVDCS